MSTDKENLSNNNPYSSWHSSKKQKQLEDKSNTYMSQQNSSKNLNKNVSQSSQKTNNNNRNNNRKKRGYQQNVEHVYVRKDLVQTISQSCNIQKNSNNDNPNQYKQQDSRQVENRSLNKTNLRQYQNQQNNFKNEELINMKANIGQEQIKEQNIQARTNQKQQVQDFKNEWSSDPKKYLTQKFYKNEDKCYNETYNIYSGKKGQIQEVLLVAEKPSVARKIASALSNKTSKKRQGKVRYLPVYVYEGRFKGQKTIFKVTSVTGHVYDLDFPQKLKENWNEINPVQLFSSDTLKIPSKHNIVRHLESEARNCSYLLLWLDNDKEGENICFEVKQICEKVMCFKGDNVQQVLRTRFSSLTKQDIIKAFNGTTDPPNVNESKAVDARRIIDLKIGASFTRYQTLFFRNKYPDLNKRTISFGPCQTPTLGFCVEREDQIKKFIPSLLYKVKLTLQGSDNKTQMLAYSEQKETLSKEKAQYIFQSIKLEKHIQIVSVSSETLVEECPVGLNTVEMLKAASSSLNMSPQQTMDAAENLYLKGFITYPRTESTAYSSSFNFKKVLSSLQQDIEYGKFAQNLLNDGYIIPQKGNDTEDHPPITPTSNYPRPENEGLISPQEKQLYDYISKHFIASLYDDYEYKKLNITCQVKNYQFISEAIRVEKQGYTKVIKSTQLDQNIIQIDVKQSSKFQIKNISIEEEYSSPPRYLSESELIDLMSKNSIGTDASIPTHIQNIVDRKYVEIDQKNRTLIPTQLGRSIIDGYRKIDEELVSPQIRAQIENSVNQIAKGDKEFSQVLNESLGLFQNKYINFVYNIKNMDNLVGLFCKTYKEVLQTAKPLSKCGFCQSIMKFIEQSEQVVCQKCDIKFYLPKSGDLKISEDKICLKDNFQIIQFTSQNSNEGVIDICPNCYSDQFYRKQKKYQL
ncbi:DNA topoisomerase I (macronuclear) [Tetrahymena thermophila SB210]|uniref:DNA topoisomerase n=1 Tax=Tetrahymena thermophila (strain SB210) TaxID=312017 RepID=I7M4N6_TETTS|nr:DNA topoisomerase I [Tetrahymena thermophila SB210]EAS07738.1 DNA topoisomerase I [Tetrahymena thermophila SB210]|eukprot:XP_001027980.1 DNA topoisomerase I [Tetrahymena thermophila SB210]